MCSCCRLFCCRPRQEPPKPKKPTPFFQWHNAEEEQPRPGVFVLGQCPESLHIVCFDGEKWYRKYDKMPYKVDRWADLTYLRSLVGTEPMYSKDIVFGKSEFADPGAGNER